ncbi:MAG: ATP-dependent helicase [Candidatus Schekmanbacteria bacterium]|nr:MAG: ATP-dependent helicase [Candidatus Schekmanbacteria bacterium]
MKKYLLKEIEKPLKRETKGIDFSKELNEAQLEAVNHLDGPILVVAGAGSGKTRTLVYRVAKLVQRGVNPESILLLTFTRKAAQEMLRRASMLLDDRCEKVSGGTFHSFANMILRRYAEYVGLTPEFTILDRTDSTDVIGMIRSEIDISDKGRVFPRKNTIYEVLSLSVNCAISTEEAIEKNCPHFRDFANEFNLIFSKYRQYKLENNLVDYDDLLVLLLKLLKNHNEIREKLSNFYRYIMIDEYQDTNVLQAEIAEQLASNHKNIMAVGDDSQSIYSFRGATFKNIMQFPLKFQGTKIVKLEQNYRSTQKILNFTNTIIERAKQKYSKKLYSNIEGGETPSLVRAPDEYTQSRFIVQKILELHEEGVNLSDIAVLFRSGDLSFDLELELNRKGIPYVKYGGFKFIETAHVKDVVAHLRIIANPLDVISWSRVLLLIEGLGSKSAMKMINLIKEDYKNREKILALANKKNKEGLSKLLALLTKIEKEYSKPSEQLAEVVEYYGPIIKKLYDNYPKRIKDLEHLITISERYKTLKSFLTDMALDPPSERKSISDVTAEEKIKDLLTLSTIHSAKGLEWHTVFIIWTLEGIFPSSYSLWSEDELEEERRLMYVASTRAKKNLYLSYPINIIERGTGQLLTKPSQFVAGISDSILEHMAIVEEEEDFPKWE